MDLLNLFITVHHDTLHSKAHPPYTYLPVNTLLPEKKIQDITGKAVHIAAPGLDIPFNKEPF
jgi:hypothetical protein